jgi:hypothetical protein
MKNRAITEEAITPAEYRAFQEAYDFFNAELFGGSLPHAGGKAGVVPERSFRHCSRE